MPSLVLLAFIVAFMVLAVATAHFEGIFWACVLLPACWVLSPKFFPRPSTRAQALAEPDRVAIYFKPADVFSMWLRVSMRNWVRRAHWVDIRLDPEADAFVRSINRDLDITPTVIAGEERKRNPEGIWVLRRVQRLTRAAEERTQSEAPESSQTPGNPTDTGNSSHGDVDRD